MGSACSKGITRVPTWDPSRCCPGSGRPGYGLQGRTSLSISATSGAPAGTQRDSSEDKGRGDYVQVGQVPLPCEPSLPVTCPGSQETGREPELTPSLSHHNSHREVPRASCAQYTPEPLLWLHPATESLDALSLPWTPSQHIPGKGISLPKG